MLSVFTCIRFVRRNAPIAWPRHLKKRTKISVILLKIISAFFRNVPSQARWAFLQLTYITAVNNLTEK